MNKGIVNMEVEDLVGKLPHNDNQIRTRYRINDNIVVDVGTDFIYQHAAPPRPVWFSRVYLVTRHAENTMRHSAMKRYEFNAMLSSNFADTRREVMQAACGVLIALGMQFFAGKEWNAAALAFAEHVEESEVR
jgi:hypothetical protein